MRSICGKCTEYIFNTEIISCTKFWILFYLQEFSAMREQYMRNGEGFLLVFSVIDRSRFVNTEYCVLFLYHASHWCASLLRFSFHSSHLTIRQYWWSWWYWWYQYVDDTFYMDLSLTLSNKFLFIYLVLQGVWKCSQTLSWVFDTSSQSKLKRKGKMGKQNSKKISTN